MDIPVDVSEGLTEDKKRIKILQRTYEIVEIALALGVKKIDGHELTLDYASTLDSYEIIFLLFNDFNRMFNL